MAAVVANAMALYREQTRNNRLGMWIFFASEAFLFAGLLAARFYLWRHEGHIVSP